LGGAGYDHDLADRQRLAAAHQRQKERQEIGGTVKPDAEHKAVAAADREVSAAEGGEIDEHGRVAQRVAERRSAGSSEA
jgi:hypothetical protein